MQNFLIYVKVCEEKCHKGLIDQELNSWKNVSCYRWLMKSFLDYVDPPLLGEETQLWKKEKGSWNYSTSFDTIIHYGSDEWKYIKLNMQPIWLTLTLCTINLNYRSQF